MPLGWSGNVLRVNLSENRSWTEDSMPYTPLFIGGRGISVKAMYDGVAPTTSAFDPENLLCLAPGVLTGTLAPSTARMKITSVAPSGLVGSSGIGGFAGAAIRRAGYDCLIIEGAAERPVYLRIRDDCVELEDASHLWGQDTQEAQRLIREEMGESAEIVCIGPAGEHLVTSASVVTGMGSVAGRHGLGAVMGSKNLKAVAANGTREVRVANPEAFTKACEEAHRWLREHPGMAPEAQGYGGDRHWLGDAQQIGQFPIGNWEAVDASWDQLGGFQKAFEGEEEFWNDHATHQYGCLGCPVSHFHVFRLPGVGSGTSKCWGWGTFAGNVWNNDRKLMLHANILCNGYGLNITATGGAISFLMELYHRGMITEEDTDGIPMRRGDERAILSTIHKIGKQEGFGRLFKNGVWGAAQEIGKGAEECAMVVNGEEMEQCEVRAFKSMALIAAIDSGGIAEGVALDYNALFGGVDQRELKRWAKALYGSETVPPATSYEGKALSVWDHENLCRAVDIVGTCRWLIPWSITTSLELPARLLSIATGKNYSEDDLLAAAQRIKTLERAFNVQRGAARKQDTLPRRLFETAVPDGVHKGQMLDREKFEQMLSEYYALRGWDEEGVPTEQAFRELGLSAEWETFQGPLGRDEEFSQRVETDA
jgi:aldehyde:ferredoxin oxidoreductase